MVRAADGTRWIVEVIVAVSGHRTSLLSTSFTEPDSAALLAFEMAKRTMVAVAYVINTHTGAVQTFYRRPRGGYCSEGKIDYQGKDEWGHR